MDICKTVIERWNSETPKFFQGIRKVAISLGGSATAVWVVNSSMNLDLNSTVLEICKYLIAISAAMGVTAQLTKVDPTNNQPS